VVLFSSQEAQPARAAVLAAQGIPEGRDVPERIGALLDKALLLFREFATPVALLQEIGKKDFAQVYQGDGDNDPDDPLPGVFPEASSLALFALTMGGGLCHKINDLFDANEFALGSMLDSVASEGAEKVSKLVERRFEASLVGRGVRPDLAKTLGYSPGYCGWHITGQRALFRALRPEEIGITLGESCLMEPIKSISGVLVAGPSAIHDFPDTFTFCRNCRDHPCRKRIEQLLNG
jgi:hypothetical protein